MKTISEKIAVLAEKPRYDFEDLIDLVQVLRSEQGCPWDREQDHKSIRSSVIEETYEVVEAIDNEDTTLLREELGDLLFQVMFHTQLEREKGTFEIDDVIHDLCYKMIHRHPHVFGSVEVENSTEVLSNWEKIKTVEKQRNTLVDKLRAIPPMMPALMRASKVGKKAGRAAGEDASALLDRLEEEIRQARAALETEDMDAGVTVGEILMSTTDLARALGVDAEYALTGRIEALIDEVAQKNG